MKALIADDSPLFTNSLVKSLDNSLQLTLADTGKEALDVFHTAHYNSNSFDLIFLDLDMPSMRGEYALQAIRSYENTMGIENAKVIIISANSDSKKVLELFNIGCDYYITKPIKEGEIANSLKYIYNINPGN